MTPQPARYRPTFPDALWLVFGLLIGSSSVAQASATADDCPVRFLDRAADSGVDFVHDSGALGGKFLPETMGAGAAWLDYDGDGWLDLYLVQSGEFPPKIPGNAAGDRLYRNLGNDHGLSTGSARRFEDVSAEAGVAQSGYGQGVLAMDFDGCLLYTSPSPRDS